MKTFHNSETGCFHFNILRAINRARMSRSSWQHTQMTNFARKFELSAFQPSWRCVPQNKSAQSSNIVLSRALLEEARQKWREIQSSFLWSEENVTMKTKLWSLELSPHHWLSKSNSIHSWHEPDIGSNHFTKVDGLFKESPRILKKSYGFLN